MDCLVGQFRKKCSVVCWIWIYCFSIGNIVLAQSVTEAENETVSIDQSPEYVVYFQSPKQSPFEADEGKGLLDWEIFSTVDMTDEGPGEDAEPVDERLFEFEVLESASPEFENSTLRYRGKDSATYLSGLSEGDYYFRVTASKEKDGSKIESDLVKFEVQFVSMSLVWKLVGMGILVFFATLWVVLKGGDPIEEHSSRGSNGSR